MVTPRMRAILVSVFALAGILLAKLGVLVLGTMAFYFWHGNNWALMLLPLVAGSFAMSIYAGRYTTLFYRS